MKQQGDDYEVIILGSGLGGLIAGAYLLKVGHPVLLLKENPYRPSYKEKGYRFVPFSNFSEKRFKESLYKRVYKDLDLPSCVNGRRETWRDKTKFKKSEPEVLFQVILPKSRIDLFCERRMFQMELEREFPKESAQIQIFYTEMEKLQSLFKRERPQETLKSVFPIQTRSLMRRAWPFQALPKGRMDERLASFSREFREFMQLQLLSWGNFFSDQFPISLANYLLSHDETDPRESEIDLEILRERILERIFQSGGMIEAIEGVERIEKRWRKGIILSLKGDARSFRSKFLIVNSPLHRLSAFFGKGGRRLSKWGERISPRYAMIPLFLGIQERVVPVGMRDLLVSLFDLNKPYVGGNLLFLSLSQKGDETEAPDGRRALTVQSLIIPETWDSDSFAEHQRGVMKHLCSLIPFLEEHIEFMDWDWTNHHFPCWFYPHFFYETPYPFQWREGIIPNRISKNVYFIGKENFPYLGMEGEFLSGLRVALEIADKYS